MKKLTITQKDGTVVLKDANGDELWQLRVATIKKAYDVTLANYIAELLNDAVNLKGYSCSAHDENDTRSFSGTVFETLSYMD